MRYATQDLTAATWPDFRVLFSRGNGWDFCACLYFLRGRQAAGRQSRAVRTGANLAAHEGLLAEGRAEGVLVYAAGRPVGWCQYGRSANLPAGGGRSQLGPTEADWRVTCFVTDKDHRGAGVAAAALKAVVEAVARRGGGLVEGYPVAVLDPADPSTRAAVAGMRAWRAERARIIRDGRRENTERWDAHMAAKPAITLEVEGVGAVAAWDRPGQQLINAGTTRMFERTGFRAVGVRRVGGETRVVMQRVVEPEPRNPLQTSPM